jgi:transcriptional regulator with XRE-family HTH domain
MDWFDRVKESAKTHGTTIEAVANAAGLSRDAYNSYRRKGNLPRANEAVAMARTLGTTVEYLVTGEEPATISVSDRQLLERARRYRPVLEDLDELEEPIRAPWLAGIHAAAETSRDNRADATANA